MRPYLPQPAQKKRKASPKWFAPLLLAIMGVGVLTIVLNYMHLMPFSHGQTQGYYLWVGLGLIAAGFVLATQWR